MQIAPDKCIYHSFNWRNSTKQHSQENTWWKSHSQVFLHLGSKVNLLNSAGQKVLSYKGAQGLRLQRQAITAEWGKTNTAYIWVKSQNYTLFRGPRFKSTALLRFSRGATQMFPLLFLFLLVEASMFCFSSAAVKGETLA